MIEIMLPQRISQVRPTNRQRRLTMTQKHYEVTLSASVLADTTVAVRANSEEEAAMRAPRYSA